MRIGNRRLLVAAVALGLITAGCTQRASTSGESAQTGDKWCSGVKVVAFPGGAQGSPFTNNVHNGYKAAEADLGPEVQYFFSDWSEEKMVAQLREAIALKPDGIAMMGHPGDAAMGPLIDQAYGQGTIVTVVNVELPNAQAKWSTKGLGYVGAPNFAAGKRLADEAVKRSGAKAGDKAFVWGLQAQAGRGERTKGIVEGFEAAGLTVVYQEIDQATNKDAQAGTATFTGVLSSNPDLKIVVTDHGALTATAETYLKAAGKGTEDVYYAGFDLGPASVKAIKSGYLDLVIDQQPFLQGYLPILQICMTKKYGFSGLYVDTAGSFVDKSNVDAVEPLANSEIR
jgi:simple sugar transport system substrate-binding protein